MDTGVADTQERREIVLAGTTDELYRKAAEVVVGAAEQRASPGDMFSIALSGGNTPRSLYELLAEEKYQQQIPWDQTQVFFSDERFVPLDSPESNFRMANEALLSRVPILERFVHPVPTEDVSPEEAASMYEAGMRRVLMAGPAEVPRFDLILLGLGPDGHTASLFPGTEALAVTDQLVAANHVPQKDSWRITFTYPLIEAAHCVLFLVEGSSKAKIVAEVLAGGDYPAARVRVTGGRLIWLLDEAAAAELPAELRTA